MLVQCVSAGLLLVGCRYADVGFEHPAILEGVPAGYTGVVPADFRERPVVQVRLKPGAPVRLYALSADAPEAVTLEFTFMPGDADLDGDLDVRDLLAFLNAFHDGEADFNTDGSVDFYDLFAFIDAYNAGGGNYTVATPR